MSNSQIGWWQKLLLVGGSLGAIAILLLLGVWLSGDRLIHSVSYWLTPRDTTPQVDLQSTIVQQIRGVQELTTAVMITETVVPTSQDLKIGDLTVATTKLLYIARGEVKAGIDLSQLTADDITVTPDKITIQLPPPSILDSKIDVDHSQVYDYDRGFLNLGPDTAPQLQIEAQRQTLTKIEAAACQQKLLATANQNAEVAITSLLQPTSNRSIEVITTSPNKDTCS